MRRNAWNWFLVLLAALLTVCTGGVGWAQTIDLSKPFDLARMNPYVAGAGVAAAAGGTYCASNSCTPSGFVLCEQGGQSAPTCDPWGVYSETDTDGVFTQYGVAKPAGGCSDGNSYVLSIVKDGSPSDYGNRLYSRTWTAANNAYVQLYVYIDSITIGDGEIIQLLRLYDTTYHTSGSAVLGITKSGTDLKFFFKGSTDASGTYSDYTTTATISVDTWYGIRISYLRGASVNFYLDTDGDGDFTDDTHTDTSTDDATPDRIQIGEVSTTTSQRMVVYFHNIKVSTSAFADDCTH